MIVPQLIYFLILSIGSLHGAYLRYLFIFRFGSIKFNKSRRILLINLIASVILGFSFSLNSNNNLMAYRESIILFLIGFAGSLSTFSSFINDLFKLLSKKKYKEFIIIIFLSIFFGLISISLGLLWGNF